MSDLNPVFVAPVTPIRRMSEIRDPETGRLTHKLCQICMEYIEVGRLWRCKHNETWDLCVADGRMVGCLCKPETPQP